jgi:hypothetical protein
MPFQLFHTAVVCQGPDLDGGIRTSCRQQSANNFCSKLKRFKEKLQLYDIHTTDLCTTDVKDRALREAECIPTVCEYIKGMSSEKILSLLKILTVLKLNKSRGGF